MPSTHIHRTSCAHHHATNATHSAHANAGLYQGITSIAMNAIVGRQRPVLIFISLGHSVPSASDGYLALFNVLDTASAHHVVTLTLQCVIFIVAVRCRHG